MLIEQIIEFELREAVPPKFRNTFTRPCTPTTGYFHEKKISMENVRVDYDLLLKYCTRQCTLIFRTWAQSLTKLNPKMQDFKLVLGLIKNKKRLKQFNFSIPLLINSNSYVLLVKSQQA